eukprot:UN12499
MNINKEIKLLLKKIGKSAAYGAKRINRRQNNLNKELENIGKTVKDLQDRASDAKDEIAKLDKKREDCEKDAKKFREAYGQITGSVVSIKKNIIKNMKNGHHKKS